MMTYMKYDRMNNINEEVSKFAVDKNRKLAFIDTVLLLLLCRRIDKISKISLGLYSDYI